MKHAIIPSRSILTSPPPEQASHHQRLPEGLRQPAIGAWSCDLSNQALCWTHGVFDIFGAPAERPMDRRETLEFYTEESRALLERLRADAIAQGTGFSMEAQILRADGEIRWMRITAATHVENGRPVRLYGMKQDVTEERLRWERLLHLAESDALTGLSNRARFQSEFLDCPCDDERLAETGALVLFDMNDFKAVNDRWGHAAGDACLAAFARRLRSGFPEARLIARLGGDEFAMLLGREHSPAMQQEILRRRLHALVAPVIWQDLALTIGSSAGMAFLPAGGRVAPEALFHEADAALYAAKRHGGTRLCIAASAAA